MVLSNRDSVIRIIRSVMCILAIAMATTSFADDAEEVTNDPRDIEVTDAREAEEATESVSEAEPPRGGYPDSDPSENLLLNEDLLPPVAADENKGPRKAISRHYNDHAITLQFEPTRDNSAKVKYGYNVLDTVISDQPSALYMGMGLGQNTLNLNASLRRALSGDPTSRFFTDMGWVLDYDAAKSNISGVPTDKFHHQLSLALEGRVNYDLNNGLAVHAGFGPKIAVDTTDRELGWGVMATVGFSKGAPKKKSSKSDAGSDSDDSSDESEGEERTPAGDLYNNPDLFRGGDSSGSVGSE